ncbi:hypothetical protein SAMN05421858_0993 [Haladaptatus litoreus]|uniref:Sjogren's syndrome/scleroderma autoantigen 1 (Autoantigen p27) n=2 Tax=Haladaptatus litoreus TaxID=553468 RepID=A0A1N6X5E9_9EURY|nr:hypothetical protein SAMN05421858_0993 [Haladaptatus litoreus]
MEGPLMGKRRSRLAEEIETLRQEIEQHREELSTYEQLRRESRTRKVDFDGFEGICVSCGHGVILRTEDRLHCTGCEYQRYL